MIGLLLYNALALAYGAAYLAHSIRRERVAGAAVAACALMVLGALTAAVWIAFSE